MLTCPFSCEEGPCVCETAWRPQAELQLPTLCTLTLSSWNSVYKHLPRNGTAAAMLALEGNLSPPGQVCVLLEGLQLHSLAFHPVSSSLLGRSQFCRGLSGSLFSVLSVSLSGRSLRDLLSDVMNSHVCG